MRRRCKPQGQRCVVLVGSALATGGHSFHYTAPLSAGCGSAMGSGPNGPIPRTAGRGQRYDSREKKFQAAQAIHQRRANQACPRFGGLSLYDDAALTVDRDRRRPPAARPAPLFVAGDKPWFCLSTPQLLRLIPVIHLALPA